jgi:DNA-binding transcriptional ArsR family regulator
MANVKRWLVKDGSDEGCEDPTNLRGAAYMLSAMSNPTRLGILLRLSRGERPVSELVRDLGEKSSTIGCHLELLRRTGLVVTKARERQRGFYGLTEMGRETARCVKTIFEIGDVQSWQR